MSLGAYASNGVLQATTSVSFTMTTTTNYPVTTGGDLQVMFDSIQITSSSPQAYSFGVVAKTSVGLWITRLVWEFGDGAMMDVPYCCRDQVSEVQYHAYSQPGSYTVIVVAFDNMGQFGNAVVTVNWITPIPEYPTYAMPLIASLLVAVFGVASIRKRLNH
jgi:PKD repeat protein